MSSLVAFLEFEGRMQDARYVRPEPSYLDTSHATGGYSVYRAPMVTHDFTERRCHGDRYRDVSLPERNSTSPRRSYSYRRLEIDYRLLRADQRFRRSRPDLTYSLHTNLYGEAVDLRADLAAISSGDFSTSSIRLAESPQGEREFPSDRTATVENVVTAARGLVSGGREVRPAISVPRLNLDFLDTKLSSDAINAPVKVIESHVKVKASPDKVIESPVKVKASPDKVIESPVTVIESAVNDIPAPSKAFDVEAMDFPDVTSQAESDSDTDYVSVTPTLLNDIGDDQHSQEMYDRQEEEPEASSVALHAVMDSNVTVTDAIMTSFPQTISDKAKSDIQGVDCTSVSSETGTRPSTTDGDNVITSCYTSSSVQLDCLQGMSGLDEFLMNESMLDIKVPAPVGHQTEVENSSRDIARYADILSRAGDQHSSLKPRVKPQTRGTVGIRSVTGNMLPLSVIPEVSPPDDGPLTSLDYVAIPSLHLVYRQGSPSDTHAGGVVEIQATVPGVPTSGTGDVTPDWSRGNMGLISPVTLPDVTSGNDINTKPGTYTTNVTMDTMDGDTSPNIAQGRDKPDVTGNISMYLIIAHYQPSYYRPTLIHCRYLHI